jgi:hypothetical protein
MGALATIIGAISDDVVEALAAASYPPLTRDASGKPGRILVGTAEVFEQSSPPRIIFEPVGSKFAAGEYYSASSALGTTERKNQAAMRTIAAENISFSVRCWGAAGTNDPVDDYDVTRALYHQVRASLQKLLPGSFEITDTGKFTTGSNVNRLGREFVFGVTFFTPVLDHLQPFAASNRSSEELAEMTDRLRAPDGVTHNAQVTLDTSNGSETITGL